MKYITTLIAIVFATDLFFAELLGWRVLLFPVLFVTFLIVIWWMADKEKEDKSEREDYLHRLGVILWEIGEDVNTAPEVQSLNKKEKQIVIDGHNEIDKSAIEYFAQWDSNN